MTYKQIIHHHTITTTPFWRPCDNEDATPDTPIDGGGHGLQIAAGVCPDWTDIDCVGTRLLPPSSCFRRQKIGRFFFFGLYGRYALFELRLVSTKTQF